MEFVENTEADNDVVRQLPKPILACDIDEVLAAFIPTLIDFHNEAYGTDLTQSHFNSFEFHTVWGGTVQDCNDKMDQFFESPHFDRIQPIHGSRESLVLLKENFDIHIVTARLARLEEPTRLWLETHYPGIFSDMHFGNLYSTEGKKKSKSQMCKDIGAVGLIDDSFNYARECVNAGIPVVLFGDYPWNREHDVSPLNNEKEMIIRVDNWSDAAHHSIRLFKS